MARIRSIKPEYWQDEKLAPMPVLSRLVFLGLVSMADDAGRLIDNIKFIDAFIFPETDDTARPALEQLAATGRILRYESSSGQRLIQITGWKKHQKVDNPSRYNLPAPSGEEREAQATDCGDSPEPEGSSSRSSRETPAKPSRHPRETRAKVSRSDHRSSSTDPRPGSRSGSKSESGPGSQERGGAPTAAATPAAPAPAVSLAAAQREQRHDEPPLRPPLIAPQLPEGVTQLLRSHYGWDGVSTLTDRQRAVRKQLRATLSAQGTRLEGEEFVRAVDRQHLSAVCAELAREDLQSPDSAIRIALVRLRESYVEVRAQREAAERTEDDQAHQRRLARARAWAAEHPDTWAPIERRVDASFGPAAERSSYGVHARQMAIDQAMLDALDAAESRQVAPQDPPAIAAEEMQDTHDPEPAEAAR